MLQLTFPLTCLADKKNRPARKPAWSESKILDRLERELQRKLNNPHRIPQAADFAHASSIGDQRVCCRKTDAVRIAKVGRVKSINEFRAELKAVPLAEGEVFEN